MKKKHRDEREAKNWLAKQVDGLVDRRAQARGGELQAVARESTVVVNRVEKCKHPQCKLCETVNTSRFVESSWRRVKYEVTDYEKRDRLVVCTEEWVVYVATCDKCGVQYVGQTVVRVNRRYGGHRADAEAKKKKQKQGSGYRVEYGKSDSKRVSSPLGEGV